MVHAMDRYWQDCPPLHLMVAAYLGVKPSGPQVIDNGNAGEIASIVPTERMSNEDFEALLRTEGLPLQ